MQEQENKQAQQDAPATDAPVEPAEMVTEDLTPDSVQAAAEAQEDASEQKIAELEAKLAEMHDAFVRAKAEGENIRRRAQEDISKAHKFAVESFAEAMVPVKDSLEMALKVEVPTVESLKEGVEITLKQLNAAFEKNRLAEVNPVQGEKLDPNKHQAISMVPADQEANTVVNVLQKGYMIADRLLRPALVTVAQGK